jgi:hypothetical protein
MSISSNDTSVCASTAARSSGDGWEPHSLLRHGATGRRREMRRTPALASSGHPIPQKWKGHMSSLCPSRGLHKGRGFNLSPPPPALTYLKL